MINNNLNIVKRFYRTIGFPGIIGCIDCIYVVIVPFTTNLNLMENQHPEYLYINRKNYHFINVQLICDSKLKILNVNSLFLGSTHDNHTIYGITATFYQLFKNYTSII